MRVNIDLSEQDVKDINKFYKAENLSKSVEVALNEAIRMKRIQEFKSLKGKISFDEEAMSKFRL